MSNKSYEKFKEKYNLPDYKKLSKDFQIDLDENEENVLETILDSMIDKVNNIMESFEGLMTGEGFSSMFEAGMLSPEDKDKLFKSYKDTKSIVWKGKAFLVKGNEEELANTINEIYNSWTKTSPEITELCEKLSEGWKNLDFKKIADTLYHR